MNNPRKWTAEEMAILIGMKQSPPSDIRKVLLDKGYVRNNDSIRGALRRLGAVEEQEPDVPVDNGSEPKILYFDIESSDLSAGFGELLCFGYWWHHESRPRVLNIYDYPGWNDLPVEQRDKYLLVDVAKILEEADVIVGHFSSKFDFPFIQTRLMIHRMKPVPHPVHIDTWRIAKNNMKLNNNKLRTIAESLNCDEQKSAVPPVIWRRAKAHDLAALKIISRYNLQDVRTQRSIMERMMPISKTMPGWNVFTNDIAARCPACGSTDLQHRGYAHTKLYKFDRLCCTNCGKWMRSRQSVTPKESSRNVG